MIGESDNVASQHLSQDIEDQSAEVLSGANNQKKQSFKEVQELSFSGKSPSVHSDFKMGEQSEEHKKPSMNKDDKLTQS